MRTAVTNHVLRSHADGCSTNKPLPTVKTPQVAVLGSRHPQHQRDAAARQKAASRPHERAVTRQQDGDVDHRACEERHEDLGDRQLETKPDLTENVHAEDHCRHLGAGIAQGGWSDRDAATGKPPFACWAQ